ncbi:MAG: NAD(P)/FAD-dependent oxidoreductase [Vulcanisaeta sp.]
MPESFNFDIVIIGGGIAGVSIARELSQYSINVAVIDKHDDVGLETTSTNHNLVCQGGDSLSFRPGTLHAELNVKSIPLWPRLADELNFPLRRIGGLWLIRDKADFKRYLKLYSRAFKSSLEPNAPYYIPEGSFQPLEFVDRKRLLDMEPYITPNALGALHDPNLCITDPVKVAKALAENAKANGVEFLLKQEVVKVERQGITYSIYTKQGLIIKSAFVINASGIEVDRIAEMVGARNFSIVPLKGTLTDFDEEVGKLISHEVHVLPRMEDLPHVKAVVPNIYGLARSGIYLELTYRSNRAVYEEAINHNIKVAKELFPEIPFERHVVKSFIGFMAYTNADTGWHDFVVDIPDYVPNWVNIVLGPAGVSASPMLGKKVVELLMQSGLRLEPKKGFDPRARRGVSS